MDNHYTLNLTLGLIDQDVVKPLPPGVWPQVALLRNAVHETIATLSPREWSFVFTNDLCETPEDGAYLDGIRALAARRGSIHVPVRLLCDLEELCRRIVAPERRARMKAISADEIRARFSGTPVLDPGHPATLTLDVSRLPATAAAEEIWRHVVGSARTQRM